MCWVDCSSGSVLICLTRLPILSFPIFKRHCCRYCSAGIVFFLIIDNSVVVSVKLKSARHYHDFFLHRKLTEVAGIFKNKRCRCTQ